MGDQYRNRAPRLDLSFPLEFTTDEGLINGHCLNLSESGLLANFDRQLDLWTVGDLVLHYGDQQCTLVARVARADGKEAGLAFSYKSDGERQAIGKMLTFATAQTMLVGPPPF